MKPLILFFLKYLLAPLLAALFLFVMSALKSVRQKLAQRKISGDKLFLLLLHHGTV